MSINHQFPNPQTYFADMAKNFFGKKEEPEQIQVNEEQEKERINLKDLYQKHDIKELLFHANGKFTAHLNNGLTVEGEVEYGQTEIAPRVFQTLESDKCEAIDAFLDKHAYTIQSNAASYHTAKKNFDRNMLAVNERLECLKEMGIAKLEQRHLPRVNKIYLLATMSDGSQLPYYADYDMVKQAGDYENEFMAYMRTKPELWKAPVEDKKALQTNAARELNNIPSSILNLK